MLSIILAGSTDEPKNLDKQVQNVFTIQEFKSHAGIDNLDIFELQDFVRKSKLIFKVHSKIKLEHRQTFFKSKRCIICFQLKGHLIQRQKIEEKQVELKSKQSNDKPPLSVASQRAGKKGTETGTKDNIRNAKLKSTENTNPKSSSSTFRPQSGQSVLCFAEFLKSLQTRDAGGRIIRDGNMLKFLLLNTSDHFSDLLTSARSIILAGGTMKPYDEVEDQLFHTARNRIYHFSCDHVIPDENLVCMSLNHGPTSKLFDFTFQKRKSPELLEELARMISNVANIVPGGMVIFLPSYDYEGELQKYLKQSGYLAKIELKKKVFREPKESSCDSVLVEYSRQIKNSKSGALLFAVVGGKLSEGINFSDDLGRCVMVVGLPYPNITSVEIKEKVNYVNNHFVSFEF